MNEMNWITEYNKLFQAINNLGSPEYFTGNRFIGIIREFDPSFADYSQYISYRQQKGLSTSRKNYFYDILMMFKEDIRKEIFKRIWGEIESKKTTPPSTLLYTPSKLEIEKEKSILEKEEPITSTEIFVNPNVFISYSWDNEEHQTWILKLATKLFDNGVNIILDRYELGPGKNMIHFMEQSISNADKVIIVFTPNYKLKAEKRKGGVGYEYSILNIDLYNTITSNNKYLPVLRLGTVETAIPAFIQQFISIDMTDDSNFDESFNQLLLAIFDKPQIAKPKLGPKPKF